MTRRLARCQVALAVTVAILGAAGAPVLAQTETGYVMTPWAHRQFTKAHELIGQSKYAEALEVVNNLKRRESRLNDHERASMWQTMGYIYAAQEKMGLAVDSFQKCLALNALSEGATRNVEFTLGQLYLMSKQYKKAVKILSEWIGKVQNPTPEAKYVLAVAFVQANDYKRALPYARQAVAEAKTVKEQWLQILLAIHFHLNQYREVIDVLERLITQFPKKEYWLHAYSAFTELKKQEEALAVLDLSHQQSLLIRESELRNLALLYLNFDIPYQAAQILDRAMAEQKIERNEDSLKLLANSWLRAKEINRAIKPLAAAAALSKDGHLYYQLAQVHYEEGNWSEAAKALDAALAKGKLSDPGNVYILLGMASFRAKRMAPAKKAFAEARAFNNSKKTAEDWLKLLRQQVGAK